MHSTRDSSTRQALRCGILGGFMRDKLKQMILPLIVAIVVVSLVVAAVFAIFVKGLENAVKNYNGTIITRTVE